MAAKLRALGFSTVASLKKASPDALFVAYEQFTGGQKVDRCVLYTFRCAVAFARDPAAVLGKNWWHFKDTPGAGR